MKTFWMIWLIPRNLTVLFLKGYRKFISPLYGDVCRYYPTCSAYGLGQIQQRGVIVGSVLTAGRIVRCNPWSDGGFDEVKNKGLDISGAAGDPVFAAADGQVVYAGAGLRGYGNLIILKHNSVYLTAYAHNQSLLVKEDQKVRKGQKIAEMGKTDSDRVKLHFEVRRQGKPVDPAKLLPAR